MTDFRRERKLRLLSLIALPPLLVMAFAVNARRNVENYVEQIETSVRPAAAGQSYAGAEWQVETVRLYGGLPLTPAARSAARSKILRDSDSTLEIAYASMKGKGASPVPHVADIDAVRIIANEELEAAWADKKPAKAALDNGSSFGAPCRCRTIFFRLTSNACWIRAWPKNSPASWWCPPRCSPDPTC